MYVVGCEVFSGAFLAHHLQFTLMLLSEFIGCQTYSLRVIEFFLLVGGYNIFLSVSLFLHRCHVSGLVSSCHLSEVIILRK